MMPKKKELSQLYGGRRPKDYALAHNHIMHTTATIHGERGFRRFWIPPQWIGDRFVECPCGWGGKTHYASKYHVDYWHERIKRLGSLDAAYNEIDKLLAAP
jgi:hypothetical protein